MVLTPSVPALPKSAQPIPIKRPAAPPAPAPGRTPRPRVKRSPRPAVPTPAGKPAAPALNAHQRQVLVWLAIQRHQRMTYTQLGEWVISSEGRLPFGRLSSATRIARANSPGSKSCAAASFVPYASLGFSRISIAGSSDLTGVLGVAIFDSNNVEQNDNTVLDFGGDEVDAVLADYRAVLHTVDLESIAARERVTRHDVKARIEEFNDLAGHEHIHKGMTSRDLTENVEQLQIRQSLLLIRDKAVATLARLAELAVQNDEVALTGRSHNVAAQMTTLGKRFATFTDELLTAFDRLESLLDRYPLRGIKGPVGTSQDMLDLVGGDAQFLTFFPYVTIPAR